jgi:hypothetical protein
MSGRDVVREIPVDFSSSQQNEVLASLWARTRIDDLMSQDFQGAQRGSIKEEVKEAVTQLGLEYRLMTQFTSFVAVEEMVVTDGGQPRRIDVPVEVPEGVNRAAVYGEVDKTSRTSYVGSYANSPNKAYLMSTRPMTATSAGKTKAGAGGGGGSGAGIAASPRPSGTLVMEADVSLSPEEQRRVQIQSKFHPSVLAVIDRLKDKKGAPGADEAKFIHNGKAEVQIWLTDKSAETMAALKALGFEVVLDPKTAKMVIGRISIEKLSALGDLKGVRYVSPQM